MTDTVDWLVAGSGAAGMTGAIAARELGGAVLLVEKEPRYGGTTCKSGGVAWIPGNHRQAAMGIADSIDEGHAYLQALTGGTVNAARLRAFTERAPEMLRFITSRTPLGYEPLPTYMDYYEQIPGYKSGGRSMDPAPFHLRKLGAEAANMRDDHVSLMPFNVTVAELLALGEMNLRAFLLGARTLLRYCADLPARLRGGADRRLTLGPAVVASLRKGMLDRDIPLWLNAPMRELLMEDGRVVGAVVEQCDGRDGRHRRHRNGRNGRDKRNGGNGQPLTIRARRGVLLATGGFAQNPAMLREFLPAPAAAEWSASAPGSTGDAITMGRGIGAALEFMSSAWWSPTYRMPDGRALALIAGKAYPRSIIVNAAGRRFANEAQPYEDFVKAQFASEARGEGAIPCYLIFDAVYRRNYPVAHLRPGKLKGDSRLEKDLFASGLLTRAGSLAELAERLGIDPKGLEDTVQRFNAHAREGIDPDFKRGETEQDRFYADASVQPNPCLGPLDAPPFYALRAEAGNLDTKGGLKCDEHGRVLHESGAVIPGLYAAGNASAAAMGDTYPGAGATIASAMTFAYLAAQHAFAPGGGESPSSSSFPRKRESRKGEIKTGFPLIKGMTRV